MKKILALLLVITMLFSLIIPTYAEEEDEETEATEPTVVVSELEHPNNGCKTLDATSSFGGAKSLLKSCNAAILYECNTETLLFAYNPDLRVFPGALVKIMTCMVLAQQGGMDDIVTVTQSMLDEVPWDVYGIDLVVGEQISMMNLMYAIMVESANDAIVVAALHHFRNMDEFVEEMNRQAQLLGCTGTHFDNAYGLHSEDQYTTARDMAKITLAASKYPAFLEVYGTAIYEMPATNLSGPRYFHTKNYMIYSTVMFNYYDPSVTGGRVGTTYMDTYNAVISAERKNAKYIIVTMDGTIKVRPEDLSIEVFGNLDDARSLLDFAYDEYKNAETVCEGQAVAQYPVVNGANDVALGAKEGVLSLLPINMTSAEIQRVVNVDESLLKAPLEAGITVGTLECWFRNFCVGKTDLVTLAPVAVSTAKVPLDGVPAEEEVAVQNEKTSVFMVILQVIGGIVLFAIAVFLLLAIRTFIIRTRRQKRIEKRRDFERRRRR